MELDDQAIELGFESYEEALAKGYEVDYEKCKLVKRGLGYSETIEYLAKEQEKAHKAWLEEKNSLLKDLTGLQEILETLTDGEKHEISSYWADTIWHAIEFIRKGEM